MGAPIPATTKTAMLELLAAGKTTVETAEHFGVAHSTVYRVAMARVGSVDRRAIVLALAAGSEHNFTTAVQHAFEAGIRARREKHGHRNARR